MYRRGHNIVAHSRASVDVAATDYNIRFFAMRLRFHRMNRTLFAVSLKRDLRPYLCTA